MINCLHLIWNKTKTAHWPSRHNYMWVSSQNAGRQSSGLHVLFLLTARWHMQRNEYPALQKAQHQFSLTKDCNKTLCQHLQKMAVWSSASSSPHIFLHCQLIFWSPVCIKRQTTARIHSAITVPFRHCPLWCLGLKTTDDSWVALSLVSEAISCE